MMSTVAIMRVVRPSNPTIRSLPNARCGKVNSFLRSPGLDLVLSIRRSLINKPPARQISRIFHLVTNRLSIRGVASRPVYERAQRLAGQAFAAPRAKSAWLIQLAEAF
jgi:hypothetical protein